MATIFSAPSHAQMASAPSQATAPMVVEEPDADDEEEQPQPPKKSITSKTKKAAAAEKPADKKNESTEGVELSHVVLQVLNKVTAHVQAVEAPIGSVVRSGTIEIIAHRCWKSSPEDSSENAALLEISEIKQGEAPARIFQGWMFSSTPGISALESPTYDVSVVSCEQQQAKAE